MARAIGFVFLAVLFNFVSLSRTDILRGTKKHIIFKDGQNRSTELLRKFLKDDNEADFQKYEHSALGSRRVQASCACVKYNCACCQHVEFDTIYLNDTICANFSYLPAPVYGVSFTVSLDGKVIIKKTISVQNPPPVCIAVPYLKKLASLCLRFHDLTFTNRTLKGCVALEAQLEYVEVEKLELGCFKIPPGNHNQKFSLEDLGGKFSLKSPSE